MGLLTDIILQDRARSRASKDNQAELYMNSIKSGALSPSPTDTDEQVAAKRQQLDYALDQYGKLTGASKEHKNLLSQAIGGLYDRVHAQPKRSGPLPSPIENSDDPGAPGQQANPAQPVAPQSGSRVLSVPTFASRDFAETAFPNPTSLAASEDQRKVALSQAERDRRRAVGESAGLKGRDLAEFQEKGNLPAQAAVGTRKDVKFKLQDGSEVETQYDPKSGVYYNLQNEPFEVPEGASRVEKQTAVNKKQIFMKYPGDKPGDAPHAVWVDPRDTSKKIDASTDKAVPDGAEVIDQSLLIAKMRSDSYSQAAKYQAAFEKAGYPPDQAAKMAGDKAIEEMDKRIAMIGAGRVHEALGVDASNASIAIPLFSTPVPNSVPARPPIPVLGQPANLPTVAPGATPQGAAPVTPNPPRKPGQPLLSPAGATVTTPTASATPPAQGGIPAQRYLPGVTASTARQAAQLGAPIGAAVTEIFGDPNQPDLKPLASYADLADDPKSKERIGRAIQLTMKGFGEGIGGASIGGSAGPVHVSAGGFGEWLQNALRVPGAVAGQEAETIRRVIADMTPAEVQAYDSTMATMSMMSGLRSMNKGSAALGAIKLIENEMPKIGINSNSSKQFYDQLQRVAGSISNFVNTGGLLPKVRNPKTGKDDVIGLAPGMMERISSLTSDLQKKKDATPLKPLGKPGSAPEMEKQLHNGVEYQRRKGSSDEWHRVKAAA